MTKRVNPHGLQLALTHGRIATPEDKARIAQEERDRAAAKAAKRQEAQARVAELERTRPEREKMKAARSQAKVERETASSELKRLQIGQRYLMTRYKLTSQTGPLMQRLRVLHGLHFTCSMEVGRGVWAERIAPPHGAPAASDPNADLL